MRAAGRGRLAGLAPRRHRRPHAAGRGVGRAARAARSPGALFGFAIGPVRRPRARSRRSASRRSCYTPIGYGAGRLRELRDPAHGAARRVAVGAAATAVATIGFSMIQFLLGVDAPVSLLLAARHLADDRRQHADRAAGLRARPPHGCGRCCPTTRAAAGAAPTRPAGSARSRGLELSGRACPRPTSAARRSRRSSRCAWRCSAASRSCCSRSSSSGSGTCRCCRATSTVAQANNNRVRDIDVPGAARRRSSTATATRWSTTAPADRGRRSSPRQAAAAAGRRARRRSTARLARVARAMNPAPDRGADGSHGQRRALPYRRRDGQEPTSSQRRRTPTCASARHDFPGVTRVAGRTCAATRTSDLAAQLFGTVGRDQPERAQAAEVQGRARRARCVGQAGIEYDLRPLPARPRRRQPRAGRRARARHAASSRRREPIPGTGPAAVARPRPARRRGLREAIARRPRAAAAAPSSRWTRATARCSRSAPRRRFDPNVFAKPLTAGAATRRSPPRPTARRCSTGRSSGALPDRLDVQADHRARRAAERRAHAGTRSSTTAAVKIGAHRRSTTPAARRLRRAQPAQALQVSSDVFFYTLGAGAERRLRRQALQKWARKLGIGAPDRHRPPRRELGAGPRCRRPAVSVERGCYQASDLSRLRRPWSAGDNVNLAVGQGDLRGDARCRWPSPTRRSPTAARVTPHLGAARSTTPRPRARRTIHAAARAATSALSTRRTARRSWTACTARPSAPGGTSADVFTGFPHQVYGKTGTAERPGQADQSWYVCYAPDPERPIVVAVTIEQGGFGAETAAPAARLILSQWFGAPEEVRRTAHSTTHR